MTLDARAMRLRPIFDRPLFLGDWGLEFVAPVLGAAIQAGGSVGAAFVTAEAQKSVAADQRRTTLEVAADRARLELALAQEETRRNAQDTAVAGQAVSSGAWVLGALALVALVLGGR